MDQKLLTIGVLASVALAVAVYDLKERRIPNVLSIGLIGYGLVYHLVGNGWRGLLSSLGGLALGSVLILVPMVIPFARKGLGPGDVKFMAGVGSVVGVPAIVAVFLLASMFGALLSLMAIRNWSQASEVRRQKSGPWLPIRNPKSEIRNQVAVPYGVAISLAVLTIAGFWIT